MMKWYNNLSKKIRFFIQLAITFLLAGPIGYVFIQAGNPGLNPKIIIIVELSVYALVYLIGLFYAIIKNYKKDIASQDDM